MQAKLLSLGASSPTNPPIINNYNGNSQLPFILPYTTPNPPTITLMANHFPISNCLTNQNSTLYSSPMQEDEDEDEDELCPVECVREFYTDEEFMDVLEKAKRRNALVVVDFYKTSCGSCKYIEQGFSKLCKASGDEQSPVIFLKHNVLDEYDEQSEVAERLRIRTVPLFHFYRNGKLLEAFPTRDKGRITEAILKYTAPQAQDA